MLELLQEGILILSAEVPKTEKSKALDPNQSLSFLSDHIIQSKTMDILNLEYVNEKFKEILKINGELSPPPSMEFPPNSEFMRVVIMLEMFEEQVQFNS